MRQVTIRQWTIDGLPLDTVSLENAIFVTRSRRWPLMIDPQAQANTWVKRTEKANKMRIIKLTQGNMLRTLEQSIRVGIPVLLENVPETLDPALDPVLLKQTYKSQGRTLIRLGDSDVDYADDFRFYITSKLSNPHYAPEVCIKVTIINFTVTAVGLEDQLLSDVASLERPDLEERKESLVVQIADGRRTIKDLEDKILKMLAEASGNILDDEDLINTLDSAKKTSEKTETAVKGAEETSKEIDAARNEYMPVATRGSVLYFVVADFSAVDPMYQYSLQYFKEIFCNTVRALPGPDRHAPTREATSLQKELRAPSEPVRHAAGARRREVRLARRAPRDPCAGDHARDVRDDLPRPLREAQGALRLPHRRVDPAPRGQDQPRRVGRLPARERAGRGPAGQPRGGVARHEGVGVGGRAR